MPDLNAKPLNDISKEYLAQRLGSLQEPQAAPAPAAKPQLFQPSNMNPDEVKERADLLAQGANPNSHPRLKELNAKWLANDNDPNMQPASMPQK